MSWQATGWAFRAPITNPGMKFVLVALAERATSEDDDPEFWTCYPSIETIAKYTAQGYRTIQRHLDALEAEGWITRTRRVISKGKLGAYDYKLWRLGAFSAKMAGGQNEQEPPAKDDEKSVSNGRTEPTTEPANGTIEANASCQPTADQSPARVAFDLYNAFAEVHGKPLATKLSDQRRRALNARLRECGDIATWVGLFDRIKASPFLMGATHHRFVISLDFILQPSSFIKLMEGKYDGERQSSRNDPARSSGRLDAFAQAALELAEERRGRG